MKTSVLLFFIAFLLLFGCHKSNSNRNTSGPVNACFSVQNDSFYVGDTVRFTDCSSNADSTLYDFGDDTKSKAPNSSHVFSRRGTYSVSLTASNSTQSNTVSKTIIVRAAIPQGLSWRYFAPGSNTDSMRFSGGGQEAFSIRGYRLVLGGLSVHGTFVQQDSFIFYYNDSELYVNGGGSFSHSDSMVDMQYTMVTQGQNGNPQISAGSFSGIRR